MGKNTLQKGWNGFCCFFNEPRFNEKSGKNVKSAAIKEIMEEKKINKGDKKVVEEMEEKRSKKNKADDPGVSSNDFSEGESEGNEDVGGMVSNNQISDSGENFESNEEATLFHFSDDIEKPGHNVDGGGNLSDAKGKGLLLRSYGPALSAFCNNGNVENAFLVEQHMLENGFHPEEQELEARSTIGWITMDKCGSLQPKKINAVVNGIQQKLPSEKWPLIALRNKRTTGQKMDEPVNKSLIQKWHTLYATPSGSNDEGYEVQMLAIDYARVLYHVLYFLVFTVKD
ncbi:Pentacotripeptide-repeat region of PRORP [Dillenia turbinata]|uniref:Pentacotripeptide-repeat region of PRORP n=1 Tax=Dillenia turbinata TaxID=194707 RepID=A0AAN8UMD9_9MAGN